MGIPEIKLADGPQGIRNHAPKSTLYPSRILSASTWNRELLYKLGQGLGQDAKARGVNILLGPGVNIYRAPLCGRNFEYFEYFGEDPYLTDRKVKDKTKKCCSYFSNFSIIFTKSLRLKNMETRKFKTTAKCQGCVPSKKTLELKKKTKVFAKNSLLF